MMIILLLVAGCVLLGGGGASPTFGMSPRLPAPEMVLRRHPTKPWLVMVHESRLPPPSQLTMMRPPGQLDPPPFALTHVLERPGESTEPSPTIRGAESSLSEIMLPPNEGTPGDEYVAYNLALLNKARRPSFLHASASHNMYHMRPSPDVMVRQNPFYRFMKNAFSSGHPPHPSMVHTTRPTFTQSMPYAFSTVVVKQDGSKEQNHVLVKPLTPPRGHMKGANGFYGSPTMSVPIVDFRPPKAASNGWIPIKSRPVITNYHVEKHLNPPHLGGDLKNESSMNPDNEETTPLAPNHKPSHNEGQGPDEMNVKQMTGVEKFNQQNAERLQSTTSRYQPNFQAATQNNYNRYGQKLKQYIHGREQEEREITENPIEAFNAEYFLQQNFADQNMNENGEVKPTRRSSTLHEPHHEWSSPMQDDYDDYYYDAPYKRLQNPAMLKPSPTNYNFHANKIPTVKPTLPGSSLRYVMTTVRTRVVHEKDRVNKNHTSEPSRGNTSTAEADRQDPIVVYPVNSTQEPFALSHVTHKTLLGARLAAKRKPQGSVTLKAQVPSSSPEVEVIRSQGQELHAEITHYHSPVRSDAKFL